MAMLVIGFFTLVAFLIGMRPRSAFADLK